MSKDLLLEIGTEEVPAHVMPGILAQLKENAEKAFKENRIAFGSVRTIGTPRRTALIVKDLAEKQEDVSSENRGPSVQIAFDADGNPSKAAQGFARGQGVDPKDLVEKDGYVYAMVHEEGKATAELLQDLLKDLICGLSFPNNMRWADLDFKFIRPLRWIVALLDDEVIPFEIAEVKSGRTSRGHRFLSQGDFEIANADSYEKACEENFILVDQDKRKAVIREQIEEVAKANGGTAEITEDLLEEVLYLVEYPTALCGKFEDKYLKLPAEAVITPMRDHQRYFPVKAADGSLMPLFITVRNGGKEHLETVQHGNERVLRARLEDAQFFFDEDRKKSLEEHREKLKTVVFQQGLGTMYEKSERLMELAEFIADELGADEKVHKHAKRAAELCKADLVTGMVQEFTELQGIMGREYAKLDGECEKVAIAIDEHYMPRFAGDNQPQSEAGRIVSVADKIDTIVGTFSRGKIPTGSQDPFALRRQALGLVNMMIEAKYTLSLSKVVAKAMDLYQITDEAARTKMQQDVADFMRLRLKNVLEDVRYDVVDAVLENVDDLYAVSLRAEAVAKFVASDAATANIQAFVRAANLAKKADAAAINEALFNTDEEKSLYQVYTATASSVDSLVAGHDYDGAIDALTELSAPIDAFFDGVMVMDKDEKIKNNRLGLLKSIDALVNRVADFSKVVL
ncbi:glycine--tRNA ligase subunit beta [Selenomonas ruminis]|uniref:Glycine--tRNA ligase beta subunit n=1 Tax=Selenomonas ruminis TaxID=2593411 RepID=A0A5D6W3S7_9FIRM|nr:glycine--tRNA ligase subunit beta [Selenomonas sp. mPRGC5]TYZ22577.1 glycine--tRNA ligase subunit beta [Selenomonas sp. mPRGC5]